MRTQLTGGIHHITAMAADPQRNLDFYVGLLGLRLIKVTVNYDNPAVYHLYYGDGAAQPGTVITFFPRPDSRPGRHGNGQVSATAFAIPMGALGYWRERLARAGVRLGGESDRFGEAVLPFEDFDGTKLELIESPGAPLELAWRDGPVPVDTALRGFHSATLREEGFERTSQLLTEWLGFVPVAEDGNRYRFEGQGTALAARVDLECTPDLERGKTSAGVVHHIALRADATDTVAALRESLKQEQYNVTPLLNRTYFESIYFRDPGGVLFEVATDGPGFGVDEPAEKLGSGLRLPVWLEERRAEIEASLPAIVLPS